MTNTRRKTFATPLEFWQWAIQFPGKRKARGREGEIWSVSLADRGFPVSSRHISGDQLASYILDARLQPRDCPLTAVEDEHGVIEEEKSDALIVALVDVGCFTEDEAAKVAALLRKEMDERIAAAVIERQEMVGFPFDELPNYRLKPKGE